MSLVDMLAATNARLDAIEARVDEHHAVLDSIRRHHGSSGGVGACAQGGLDAVLDRLQQVSLMREEAEAARFERADEERLERVEELDVEVQELKKEKEEQEKELEDEKRRNRRMHVFLVAFCEGDLTKQEVRLLFGHEV
jgi:vacuolar-type H+-ATPase subunit I/STV1